MSAFNPPPGPPPPGAYAPPPGHSPPDAGPTVGPSTDAILGGSEIEPNDPPPAYSKTAPSGSELTSTTTTALETIAIPSGALKPEPLDPPPDCFSTPTPARIRSNAFAPFRVPSAGRSLGEGFEPLYAPALASHGLTSADWAELLTGLRTAALLAQNGLSAVAPSRAPQRAGIGGVFLGGPRAAAGRQYDKAFVKTPMQEVEALLAVWQGSALERRKVKVSLRQQMDEGRTARTGYYLLVEAL